jgi:hypothetical protein
MTYDEFKKTLKKCDLTIKEFANMCGLNPDSISANWKKANETPKWVDAFLSNYQKAKIIDDIKEKVCPVKGNDE